MGLALKLKQLLLVFTLLMSFRYLQFFPMGLSMVQEAWYVICVLMVFFLFPSNGWKFNHDYLLFMSYIGILIFMIPLISGVAAWLEFGQPVSYGMLAARSVANYLSALLIFRWLLTGFVTLKNIERGLILLAWGTMLINVFIYTFLDPLSFDDSGIGFVIVESENPSFKLPYVFLLMGVFYYAFIGLRERRVIPYIFSLVFLLAILGNTSGRSMLVSILITFLFFVVRWTSSKKVILYIPKLIVGFVFLVAFYALVDPNGFSERIDKFSDAFNVVFSNQEVDDYSANARIFEKKIAAPFIERNPWLGSGNISNQWNDGYLGNIGYFHPSDIGITGILFLYGIVGLLAYCFQYYFAIYASRRIPFGVSTPLLDMTKGYLFFSVLYSLVTGLFVHAAEANFIFIAILLYMATSKEFLVLPKKTF